MKKEGPLKRILLNRNRVLQGKCCTPQKQGDLTLTGAHSERASAAKEEKSAPIQSYSEGVLPVRSECRRHLDQALYLSYLQRFHNGL